MIARDRKTVRGYGEFRLIDRIREKVDPPGPPEVGIGDDAAVLAFGEGRVLLTTDAFVQGIHFDSRLESWTDIGTRMVTAAVSDVAAMGGRPRHVVLSLCIPRDFPLAAFDQLTDGMIASCRAYGTALVGGDTVRTVGRVVVSMAVTGVLVGKPILRSGAVEGDLLAVTGRLGGSLAGLEVLKDPSLRDKFPGAVRRHLQPTARVREAGILAGSGLVTSMIDVSDGLSSEAHHLADSSGVGIRIDAERVPLFAGLDELAPVLGKTPLEMALASGEEFELLFTVSAQDPAQIDRLFHDVEQETQSEVTRLGSIVPRSESVVLLLPDATIRQLPPQGYDHF